MFTILNYDVISLILYQLDIEDTLFVSRVCIDSAKFYKSSYMIRILSGKLNMDNANLDQLLSRYHFKSLRETIALLHRLYEPNDKAELFLNDIQDTLLLEYKDSNENFRPYVKDIISLYSNVFVSRYRIILDTTYLEMKSMIIINYNTIIIKYDKYDDWASFGSLNLTVKQFSLSSRCYIKIDESLNQIFISKDMKGSQLIIEDILFSIRLIEDRYEEVFCSLKYLMIQHSNHDILYIQISP